MSPFCTLAKPLSASYVPNPLQSPTFTSPACLPARAACLPVLPACLSACSTVWQEDKSVFIGVMLVSIVGGLALTVGIIAWIRHRRLMFIPTV